MMSLKISDVSDEISLSGHFTNLGSADFRMGVTVDVGFVTSVASVTDGVLAPGSNDVEVSSLSLELQATRDIPAAKT